MERLLSIIPSAAAVLIAALLTAGLALSEPAHAAGKPVGIASAVVNDVQIRPAPAKTYAKAKLRQRVALGDRAKTAQKSRLQLLLLDKTKFTLGANAELTIDTFVYDPDGGSVSASLTKGALRFMSGSSRKAKKSVSTPSATIGIRGTVFDAVAGQGAVDIAKRERAIPRDTQHDPATATLVVLRGPGPNRQAPALPVGLVDVTGASETATLDAPMRAAYVPYAGAEPIGPFTISPTGLGQLGDFILPPPERDFAPFTPDQLPFQQRERRRPTIYGENGQPMPGDTGAFPDVPGVDYTPEIPQDPYPEPNNPDVVRDPVMTRDPAPVTSPNDPATGQRIP